MKTLIFFLLILSQILSCDNVDENDIYKRKFYDIQLVVSGNCPFVKINNLDYYGLQYGTDYEIIKSVQLDNKVITQSNIKYKIEKMTDDSSTLSYEFYVDGNLILSDLSNDPYVSFEIDYTLLY